MVVVVVAVVESWEHAGEGLVGGWVGAGGGVGVGGG